MKESILLTISIDDLKSLINESVKSAVVNCLPPSLPSPNNPNERITRQELRERYKVSLGTIHNYMKSGDLPYEKIGRKTLFLVSDVEGFFRKSVKNNPP